MSKDIKVCIKPPSPNVRAQPKPTLNPLQKPMNTQRINSPVSKKETLPPTKHTITVTNQPTASTFKAVKQEKVTTEMPIVSQVWVEKQGAAGKQLKAVRIVSNLNGIVLFCAEQGIQEENHSVVYAMQEQSFFKKWKNLSS